MQVNVIRSHAWHSALTVIVVVSVPDILSQLELECEKERYRAEPEIGSLVTFVKADVGSWSHDLTWRSVNRNIASSCLFIAPQTESA